jgi:glycyl-tRNA synthetase beta subunit
MVFYFHRLDSLVGLFGAGCQPSSSNDPFGLRRISYGLVREVKIANIITYKYSHNIFYLGPNIGRE